MKLEVFPDDDSVARRAAAIIAQEARVSVVSRARFTLAVSGGRTPWKMLRNLADEEIPWDGVHIFQVDERAAPEGHPDRNLTHLRDSLPEKVKPNQVHVLHADALNLDAAAAEYGKELHRIAGIPAVLDLVHLGLGPDGHTASLVPEDSVLNEWDDDVAATGLYQGRRRITLTYPIINRSRFILWVVTGSEKKEMLGRLYHGDPSIPAGRVARAQALVLTDQPI